MKKRIGMILLTIFACLTITACGNTETENKTKETKTKNQETSVNGNTLVETPSGQSDTLVVYFSCTGTTQGVAEAIAKKLDADMYEIVPEQPYTSDDLNYNDEKSRSTKEMKDSSSRPAISGKIEHMEQYDRIVLGYPIWWGEAPRILATFVESYDFSGKTIIPFCTSGGSEIGSSAENLKSLAGSGTWMEGKRISSGESGEEAVKALGIEN